jgi:hypothetical protein
MPMLSAYNGNSFSASSNSLPSSQINSILAMIVSWGSTPNLNFIYIQSQTPPAPPTGNGITDKATLIAAGKYVVTD